MGKVKKRAQKYRYHVNRKKMYKKLKKGPLIESDVLREHWDKRTSVKKNLKGMGLCADPNQMMSVPLTKETMIPGNDDYDPYFDEEKDAAPKKTRIVENIEKVAASGKKREEQMSADESKFISHLLQKYASSDLEAMARDYKNYWQNTPLQIKKKIDRFARVHPAQYEEYTKTS